MTKTLRVPRATVDATIAHLRNAGSRHNECVVLWLARRAANGADIVEVYRPEQIAARDMFRIPPASMNDLLGHLGEADLFIGAQVHSHPREAFHSEADDRWAIIRHVGAVSIVVPHFASAVTSDTFLAKSAMFVLDARNEWVELPRVDQQQSIALS